MGILNVDNIQPVGGGTTITLNSSEINVGAGITLESNGQAIFAGIVTATHFYGSGANLTGLPAGTTINNNAANRIITGEGGTTLNGEANLLFDGGTLALNGRYQRGSATVQDGDAIAGGININGLDMDASVIMSVFGNDGDFTRISGSKSRNASVGSHTIVQDNDVLLSLKGFGSDGTNFEEAAQIEMQVDGTPGNNVMPGRIVFKTTTTDGVAERLRITSTGIIDAPTQAGFYARMQNNKNNVMGGGASYYTVLFDTDSGSICYDQHNAYDTSTGLYTVPTGGDGHYMVSTAVCLSTDAYGRAGEAWFLVGSNRYFFDRKYFTSTSGTITGYYGTSIIKLTAGQTVGVQAFVSGGSTDVDVLGANATDQITWFTARKIA